MTALPMPAKEREDLIKEIRFLRFAVRQRNVGDKVKLNNAIREISKKLNDDDERKIGAAKEISQ